MEKRKTKRGVSFVESSMHSPFPIPSCLCMHPPHVDALHAVARRGVIMRWTEERNKHKMNTERLDGNGSLSQETHGCSGHPPLTNKSKSQPLTACADTSAFEVRPEHPCSSSPFPLRGYLHRTAVTPRITPPAGLTPSSLSCSPKDPNQ